MADKKERAVRHITDARTLRALAHPIRISLIGVLRREGALTATQAGELLGESSASCSFHLRQLAKYGLVEEAGGGKGRERPWRATAMFTNIPDFTDNPELAAVSELVVAQAADRYFEHLMRWLEAKPGESPQWQQAAHFGDTLIYVTAEELAELAEQEQALVDRYLGRLTRPDLRPPGSRAVTYLHLAFPGDLSGARPQPPPGPSGAERPGPERAGGPGQAGPGQAGAGL